jgi:hypothetical protein
MHAGALSRPAVGGDEAIDNGHPEQRRDWVDTHEVDQDAHQRCDGNDGVKPFRLARLRVQAVFPAKRLRNA